MNTAAAGGAFRKRSVGRSIGAVAGGMAAVVILSLGSDVALRSAGLFPALSEPMSDRLLLLATAYRTLYGVIGGYVTARLAPDRPLPHALIFGMIGLAISIVGAAATWNGGLGPHWYPLALIALALPQAWAGGKLRVLQQGRKPE